MNKTLVFIFLFIFIFIVTISYFKTSTRFIFYLKFLDGVQYFLYTAFAIGCILLLFQEVHLPYVEENPILFKFLIALPLLNLFSVFPVLDAIKNPQNPARIEVLNSLARQEEMKRAIEESQKILEETHNWEVKYMDILNRCNQEIEEVNKLELSDEEKEAKANEIVAKYNKEIEMLSSEH